MNNTAFFLNLFLKSKDGEITVGIEKFTVKHKYNFIRIRYGNYNESPKRITLGPSSFYLPMDNCSLFGQNFQGKYFDSKKDAIHSYVNLFLKIKNISL